MESIFFIVNNTVMYNTSQQEYALDCFMVLSYELKPSEVNNGISKSR